MSTPKPCHVCPMSSEFEDKPYSDSHLDSPEYRRRLMRKLNTLIAVLEVACVKVRRSLNGPKADVERLERIQKNLKDTLQVCMRAKRALERCERLPKNLPSQLGRVSPQASDSKQEAADEDGGNKGSKIEMSSPEELEKFSKLGPIDSKEIRSCNLDELCRQLLGF